MYHCYKIADNAILFLCQFYIAQGPHYCIDIRPPLHSRQWVHFSLSEYHIFKSYGRQLDFFKVSSHPFVSIKKAWLILMWDENWNTWNDLHCNWPHIYLMPIYIQMHLKWINRITSMKHNRKGFLMWFLLKCCSFFSYIFYCC